ncbi:hypothetical protein JXK06_02045 [Patescibacteria group bacterium]|nr:hypothetical protein [Patescibacteria group bacterium]
MMLKNLFSSAYWFELMPGPLGQSGKIFFLTLLLVFLIGAVFSAIYKKKTKLYKKTLRRSYDFFAGNFVLAIIFFFFRYETLPFLSGRFWLGAWFLLIVFWLYFILKDLKHLPEKRKEAELQKIKDKYIP